MLRIRDKIVPQRPKFQGLKMHYSTALTLHNFENYYVMVYKYQVVKYLKAAAHANSTKNAAKKHEDDHLVLRISRTAKQPKYRTPSALRVSITHIESPRYLCKNNKGRTATTYLRFVVVMLENRVRKIPLLHFPFLPSRLPTLRRSPLVFH